MPTLCLCVSVPSQGEDSVEDGGIEGRGTGPFLPPITLLPTSSPGVQRECPAFLRLRPQAPFPSKDEKTRPKVQGEPRAQSQPLTAFPGPWVPPNQVAQRSVLNVQQGTPSPGALVLTSSPCPLQWPCCSPAGKCGTCQPSRHLAQPEALREAVAWGAHLLRTQVLVLTITDRWLCGPPGPGPQPSLSPAPSRGPCSVV